VTELFEIRLKNKKGISSKMTDHTSLFSSFLLLLLVTSIRGIKIDTDGGYTDLVIQIQDQVPEDHCPEILENLKVSMKDEKNET
jgi:hypothetical protein